jgi:hypothetical protein
MGIALHKGKRARGKKGCDRNPTVATPTVLMVLGGILGFETDGGIPKPNGWTDALRL